MNKLSGFIRDVGVQAAAQAPLTLGMGAYENWQRKKEEEKAKRRPQMPQGYTPPQVPQNIMQTASDNDPKHKIAFEFGVEKFCKQAGFDEDDTKAMKHMVSKVADWTNALPFIGEQLGGEGSAFLRNSKLDDKSRQSGSSWLQTIIHPLDTFDAWNQRGNVAEKTNKGEMLSSEEKAYATPKQKLRSARNWSVNQLRQGKENVPQYEEMLKFYGNDREARSAFARQGGGQIALKQLDFATRGTPLEYKPPSPYQPAKVPSLTPKTTTAAPPPPHQASPNQPLSGTSGPAPQWGPPLEHSMAHMPNPSEAGAAGAAGVAGSNTPAPSSSVPGSSGGASSVPGSSVPDMPKPTQSGIYAPPELQGELAGKGYSFGDAGKVIGKPGRGFSIPPMKHGF